MARISIGQQKILDRFKRLPGATLKFDQQIGRYRFHHEGKVIDVDQRPVEVMLRTGVLEKSTMGQCYPAADAPWNNTVMAS
jgi:hypothetical protein